MPEQDDRFEEDDRPRSDPDRPRRGREDWDDDRPRRRRPDPGPEATDFLIPTNVSGWSIAACYFGLVSCVLPFVGLVLAIGALICGIVALRQRKKNKQKTSYGSVTSDMRAIIGVVASSLTILTHLFIGVAMLANAK